jgi:hypothetical protein
VKPKNLGAVKPKNLGAVKPKNLGAVEALVGFEPTDEAFAEPCLTTWLQRPTSSAVLGGESPEPLKRGRVYHLCAKLSNK